MRPFARTIRIAAACVAITATLGGCGGTPTAPQRADPESLRRDGTGVFVGGGYVVSTTQEDTTKRGGVFVGGGY